ncbi:unnamed protein product [Amaranthus hypochondriacus]
MLTISASMSTPSPNPTVTPTPPPSGTLPLRQLPGSYGWPIIGPIGDRLNYTWFQGQENFFKKKIEKYKSTVFRTNVPPCFPFFVGVNPNVIAVLDVPSFAHLFDSDIIEKKDVLVGDFMPSTKYTGDMRVGVYQDTTEENHTKVKNFVMDILKKSSRVWVTSLISNLDIMWNTIEESISKDGSASLLMPLQKCLFNFLAQAMLGANPSNYSQELSESGHIMVDKWLALQLLPIIPLPILQPLTGLIFQSFPYPYFLVQGDYSKLVDFVEKEAQQVIEIAKTQFGLTQQEAIHNLLFILGFNAFGGFSLFLPAVLTNLGTNKDGIQDRLRKEVREKCSSVSLLGFDTVQSMPNVGSFVYETLRLKPPVPLQYGRARRDFVIQSHDSRFEVKKGELLCGFQPLVMRDPKVFYDPNKFVPNRFVGEKGGELLSYLYWSNGSQTGNADASNKQCAAKDYVPLTACLFVAHMLLRYDSISLDSSGNICALEKV